MKLEKVTTKCKCDIGLCKKDAQYAISGEGVISRRKVYMCSECAEQIYSLLGKEFVPKSPVNMIVRAERRREETL